MLTYCNPRGMFGFEKISSQQYEAGVKRPGCFSIAYIHAIVRNSWIKGGYSMDRRYRAYYKYEDKLIVFIDKS